MIGILGGTFDPVHHGHLRVALDVQQALQLREVRLIPCRQSPLRDTPVASGAHRLAMLRAAVAHDAYLRVDARELDREGVSYTVETLAGLRAEAGDEALCFICGMDAFRSFLDWHDWQGILHLGHIVVAHRPEVRPPWEGELATLLSQREVHTAEALREQPAGNICLCEVTQLDISATRIRRLIAEGGSPRYLLPDVVWDYINDHRLYQ
jgi:nicotinate-nucleotide adenylyltransferase